MTIKECYGSTNWHEIEVVVESAWTPNFVKQGGMMEQAVSISDESGDFVIVNRAIAEEQFVDMDDEGKKQRWKLRNRNGILQGWNQEPAVMGKTKQYRDYFEKGAKDA